MANREAVKIFDEISESVAHTTEMIEALGEAAETASANSAVEDITTIIREAAENANLALEEEAAQLGVTTEALADYLLHEQMADAATIDTSQECAALLALAGDAKVTSEVYQMLLDLLEIYTGIESGVYGQGTQDRAMALQRATELKAAIEAKLAEGGKPVEIELDYKLPDTGKNRSAGGKAGKDAGEAYKEAFDKELSKLKESYDRGEIDLQTYLAKYRDLIEKYFHDTEKYAEERAQALHDYLAELKGYYDAAISGVTTLIDHKIKGVQKQKDAALKAIEAERKAATAAYEQRIEEIDRLIKQKNKEIKQIEKAKKALEKQIKVLESQRKELEKQKTAIQKNSIDPLQKEIDKMREANEERDRSLTLQKKLYELERAQNQRTQLVNSIANLHSNVMIIKVTISVKGIWECRDRGKTEFRCIC